MGSRGGVDMEQWWNGSGAVMEWIRSGRRADMGIINAFFAGETQAFTYFYLVVGGMIQAVRWPLDGRQMADRWPTEFWRSGAEVMFRPKNYPLNLIDYFIS